MRNFFANKWTKRFFSIIALGYTFLVCVLSYYSIFYHVSIDSKLHVGLYVTAASVIGLSLLLYTRKQLLTRLSSFLILPLMLPVVLLYFGEWEIIIPVIVVGVMILLLSGAGEGAKTAFGTIILLLYIFGALGYFLFTSFFVPTTKQTTVESGISPSGRYRYRIINTEDSSNGSTAVYIEPNYADVTYPHVVFTLKNMERIVSLSRPILENVDIQWKTQERQEITSELEKISENIKITLSDKEMEEYGHSFNERLYLVDTEVEDRFAIGLTASDVDPIPLESLDSEQLAVFNLARDSEGNYYIKEPGEKTVSHFKKDIGENIYLYEMDDDWLNQFYIEKDNTLLLKDFTDSQLADLGVSESGDVMILNGKVIFRYYVAEIEDYFDINSRKLSVDLLT